MNRNETMKTFLCIKARDSNTRRGQLGAEVVEFALVLPMLLMLMLAIMQCALLLYSHVVLAYAASTGARVLAVQRGYDAPYTDTRNAILSVGAMLVPSASQTPMSIAVAVGGTLCQGDETCAAALGPANSVPAAALQASVSLDYPFTPLFGGWFGAMPKTLHANMSELVQ